MAERHVLSAADRRRCRRTAERDVETFERELAAKWTADGTPRVVSLTQTKAIATLGKHCAPDCAQLRSSASGKPLCFIDRSFAPIENEGEALLRTPVCLATEPTMGRKQ